MHNDSCKLSWSCLNDLPRNLKTEIMCKLQKRFMSQPKNPTSHHLSDSNKKDVYFSLTNATCNKPKSTRPDKFSPHYPVLKLHPGPDSPLSALSRDISWGRFQGEKSIVRNAISSRCSHPLMLGMNWPGKLITTQESIHDTEGTVVLTAVLISDSLNWATVNVSSHKPFLARTQLKAPNRNFLQICLSSMETWSHIWFISDSFLFLLVMDVLWSNDNASHCGVLSCCSTTGAAVRVRNGALLNETITKPSLTSLTFLWTYSSE